MHAIYSIAPILGSLMAGWLMGWALPATTNENLVRFIGPLVWVLLFLIGLEFESALSSLSAIGYVVKTSLLMIVATTLGPCALLLLLFGRRRRAAITGAEGRVGPALPGGRSAMVPALKECGLALLMMFLGLLCGAGMTRWGASFGAADLPFSHAALLILIILVGVDLSSAKMERGWFSLRMLSVPAVVLVGSIVGALVVHFMTGSDLKLLLALATGFGWFSLSGALVGSLAGEVHGATALFVDLGREFVAIMLLYLLGSRHPVIGVATAGATAMDSTLPIIRQACRSEVVPMALVSGFVLTILAPLCITLFLG